jgi:hypothetical protein
MRNVILGLVLLFLPGIVPCLAGDSKECKKARKVEREAEAAARAVNDQCDPKIYDPEPCTEADKDEVARIFVAAARAAVARKRACHE